MPVYETFEPPESFPDDDDDAVWVCPNCTSANAAQHKHCQVCREPRPLDWAG